MRTASTLTSGSPRARRKVCSPLCPAGGTGLGGERGACLCGHRSRSHPSVSRDLPVMIWIYGGAFLMGSGHGANFLSNYLYDGEEIATRGSVVVVTFNYRVGPLGFLSTGDSNLPGNYGLRDQHMAIAWVKRNIAAFGGDPNNITVFGESAGGASVSLQMLSPYNKGLIKRGISQSGVALSPWAIQKNPLFWAKTVAEKVGCPMDDTARMARCLKITDPRALTLAYRLPLTRQEYPVMHYLGFTPVVDGDFIPDDPANLFANAADIDYLAGTNDMDGHLFATVDLPAIDRDSKAITEEDFYKLVSGFTAIKGPRGANTTFDVYTESWAQDSSQETKKKTVVALETDVMFLMPTEMAVAQHRANAKFQDPGRAELSPHLCLQRLPGLPGLEVAPLPSQSRDLGTSICRRCGPKKQKKKKKKE
uniref:Carboxylic ester hydrolase n=1 Tax=Catagonus wagneri TaxID=51154 RepID=A0A8C3W198_9CETA